MKITQIVLFLTTIVLFTFCNNIENNSADESLEQSDTIDAQKIKAQKVKVIFHNVPSPLELTSMLERMKAPYTPDAMNKLTNSEKYTTNSSIALNLGVYGADLSYTRIFDQVQATINYLAVIKKFSEKLGIPQDKNFFSVDRIERNIGDRDSLLEIITETYSNADEYLKENQRGSTAALIIFGGWVETMHLATQIMKAKGELNEELVNRIVEQKYSLDNLIEYLEMYSNEDFIQQNIQNLLTLKSYFDEIQITTVEGEVITNKQDKTTTIQTKHSFEVKKEQIERIALLIKQIREDIIKG